MDQTENNEETTSQITPKDKQLIEETRWLLDLPPDERTKYVRDTLHGLSQSIKTIATTEGSLKDKLNWVNAFLIELDEKAPELIPPITYAVKPEYQESFKEFLRALASNS